MVPQPLSVTGRYLILAAAFLGWLLSGVQMTSTSLVSGSATKEFLAAGRIAPSGKLQLRNLWALPDTNGEVESITPALAKEHLLSWYARYNSSFLLGAALGGLLFGWIGDRAGRVRAMAASILCYSLFAGLGYWTAAPEQLLVLRFLCGMGVGGMWPTGVSLAAEAWSDASRPLLAGLLGTSANIGIFAMSALSYYVPLTPESWRWVMLVGAGSAVLGVAVALVVPESPAWLAAKASRSGPQSNSVASQRLLSPPLLWLTLVGIALGTIPVLGGWGVTNWFIAWTENVNGTGDFKARALTAMMRSGGATIGGLLGGWIAMLAGRRTTYFLISLCSFALAEYIYLRMHPSMPGFSLAVFAVGMVSTAYFGWLPLYLPELFPTHVRATGAGISFNTGRVLSALGVLATGALTVAFKDRFYLAGATMSLVYAAGMLVILFAPDTTGKKLSDNA